MIIENYGVEIKETYIVRLVKRSSTNLYSVHVCNSHYTTSYTITST